jgi:gliding motility-associated-like protein
MKNKNNKENMIQGIINSTGKLKSVLFLFLGLLLSMTVKSQNCQIIDSAIVTDVRCFGGNDGAIDLVLLNPLGGYSFAWNTTAITQNTANLPVGVYSVTITDLANPACYQDTVYTIAEPQDPLTTAAVLYSDVDCFGDSSGVAYAQNAIGGTFPYTYSWNTNPVQNTQLAVNLWAGTHTVTVTDANGCTAQASIDIVNSYPAIIGTPVILNQVSCFGACDANVEFSSIGGVLPYTYNWSVGQAYPPGSGPDTAFNLCYGGHDVLIEDALGCRKTVSFIITQPDELFANAIGNGAVSPSNGVITYPVQCYGFDNGTAFAMATQGTSAYTFVWDSINGPTGQNIDSLIPGIHTVYVTDANGCTASDTVLITEPTQLVVDIIDSLAIYAYCSNTNSGELCAVASGGTPGPGYIYAWNDDMLQTTPCAYNLVAQSAVYTITVLDDRGCVAEDSFSLDSITNSMNEDSVVIIEDSVSCFGLYDGALTATNVVGGVGAYTYSWVGPGIPPYTGTGSSISSLYAGNYSLLISDINGCQITTGIYLNEPDELRYDIYNTVDETCLGADNGQIWVHINGGTGQYYYDSTEVGTFSIPSADQVLVVQDSLIFNLDTGTHSIYITDDHNCEGAVTWGTGTGGWQRDINPMLIIPTTNFVLSSTSCYNTNNGTAQVLDPSPLFTYTWEAEDVSNPGNPTGVDISNGAGTFWGDFAPGDYWVVAHYADSASFGTPYYGCDNNVPFTILPGTTPIIADSNIIPVSCYSYNDGQVDLNITGGVAPYDLHWDTTSVTPGGLSVPNILNYSFNNLTVGTYAVTIIDSDSCVAIENYEITEPSPLISDITPTHVSCFGLNDGQAIVNTVNGVGTITYLWSDTQAGQTATSLSVGNYTVTVTDDQGCTYTDSIDILQPANPVALVEADDLYYGDDDVRCFGESNAAAIVTGSGVSFIWKDAAGTTVLTTTNSNTGAILSAGQYTVTSTDENGCTGSGIIIISDPAELIISVLESNPSSTYHISCFGANDGWAEVTITGGVESNNVFGYDISWLNSAGNTIIGNTIADNLSAGFSYTVTVNDANGCEAIATTNLYTEPIEFDAQVTTINYAGPFHGPLNISFIDSTLSAESYSFEWIWQDGSIEYVNGVSQSDNQVFIHQFLETELDTNYVSVMLINDITGCQDSVEFIIEVQGMPDVVNVFTPNNDGVNEFFLFSEYAMESVDVQIFNRWGQLVKSWVGSDKSWNGTGIDGKDLPEGVYFYVFVGEGVDGHYYDKKGSVTLLR